MLSKTWLHSFKLVLRSFGAFDEFISKQEVHENVNIHAKVLVYVLTPGNHYVGDCILKLTPWIRCVQTYKYYNGDIQTNLQQQFHPESTKKSRVI